MALTIKEQQDFNLLLNKLALAHGFRDGMFTSNLGTVLGSSSTFNDAMLAGQQTLSGPGAALVTTHMTHLTTTGIGDVVTLADGLYVGQRKNFVGKSGYVTSKTSFITPTHFADGVKITFSAKFDACELMWDGTNWNIAFITGASAVS